MIRGTLFLRRQILLLKGQYTSTGPLGDTRIPHWEPQMSLLKCLALICICGMNRIAYLIKYQLNDEQWHSVVWGKYTMKLRQETAFQYTGTLTFKWPIFACANTCKNTPRISFYVFRHQGFYCILRHAALSLFYFPQNAVLCHNFIFFCLNNVFHKPCSKI